MSKIDYMTCNVQTALETLTDQDFNGLANDVIEYILSQDCDQNAPFTWGDVENYFIDNSEEIEIIQEKIAVIEEYKDSLYNDYINSVSDLIDAEYELKEIEIEALEIEIEALEDEQETPQEVMQWFKVSPYLYRQLNKQGCVVLETPNGFYWGRCSYGQSVTLDSCIIECYKDNYLVLEAIEKDSR